MLLSRLRNRFGVCDTVLDWLSSYLSGRHQTVVVGNTESKPTPLHYGVPQGSVLGPILFSMYISPLSDIAKNFHVITHKYEDDCQLYIAFRPKQQLSIAAVQESIESCVSAIGKWMVSNMLKQNDAITELLVFSPPRIQHSLSVIQHQSGRSCCECKSISKESRMCI